MHCSVRNCRCSSRSTGRLWGNWSAQGSACLLESHWESEAAEALEEVPDGAWGSSFCSTAWQNSEFSKGSSDFPEIINITWSKAALKSNSVRSHYSPSIKVCSKWFSTICYFLQVCSVRRRGNETKHTHFLGINNLYPAVFSSCCSLGQRNQARWGKEEGSNFSSMEEKHSPTPIQQQATCLLNPHEIWFKFLPFLSFGRNSPAVGGRWAGIGFLQWLC